MKKNQIQNRWKQRLQNLLILLFLGSSAWLSAQTSDSLLQTIDQVQESQEQMKQLEELCLDYLWTKPLLADTLIRDLEKRAEQNKSDFYKARTLFFEGMLQYKRQKLEPAFDLYTEARKILENGKQGRALAEVYHNIGLVYLRFREYDKMKEFLNKARDLNKKNGDMDQYIKNEIALISILPTFTEQIEGYRKIGALSKEHNYEEGQFISRVNIATLMNNSKRPDSALVYLNQAEELWDLTGNDKYINNVYQLKGLIYNRQKKYGLAKKYLEMALEVNARKDHKARMLELYLNLAGIHVKQNDYKTAYEYMQKHRHLQYEFDLQKKAESVARIEADYRVELKENENKLLRKEAELNEHNLQTAQRQRVLLILILLVSVLAIALLTGRYITRQKHIKEQEEANRQLQLLNHEMESVLQVVSHDFRTPLAKINMLSDLIKSQEGDKLSENARDKLLKMRHSIREAEELVSDILEIKSFYREEEYVSNPEAFSIREELGNVLDQFKNPIEIKDLDLRYEHVGEEAFIQEKDLVKRIAGNLISNAVKFTENNKKIRVETEIKEGRLRLKVQDQGPGFTEEEQENMYRKFAEFSNKPIGWGTSHGLGLFIVKKLIDRMKGSIELESEKGQGSTFTVELASVRE